MDQRVKAVIAFLNGNLHHKLTASEIAQSVHLSPSRLREIFKEQTGKSLTQYRRGLQLERAKRLLETTFLSVKEVAASIGTGEVSHFIRDFEKKYGSTPARYAECHRTQARTSHDRRTEPNRGLRGCR